MRCHLVLAGLLAVCMPAVTARAAGPPPAEAYAALPIGQFPRLSPDGKSIAMLSAAAGKPAFVIVHLDGRPVTVVSTGGWLPDQIEWKTSELLVATVHTTFLQDEQIARPNFRLLVLAADGSRIMPVDLSFNGGFRNVLVPINSARLISMLPQDPTHVLMATLDNTGPGVSRIDVRNGGRSQVQDSRRDVYDWFADQDGVIRAAESLHRPSSNRRRFDDQILARSGPDDSWHVVVTDRIDGTQSHDFAGFDPADPGRIRLLSPGPDDHRIIENWRIGTGHPESVLAQEPGTDVDLIRRDQQVIGFAAEGPNPHATYFDAGLQHDVQAISRALGGGSVAIADRTEDGRHVLAKVQDGAMPEEFWMLDRSGPKTTLKPVIREYEDIAPDQIAPAHWITYTARDGLRIPAMLTLPPGKSADRLPFVVLPHGGPTAHDSMGFDFMAQFMASRGYGVLQPQFRGSTGFGQKLQEAGLRQWGRGMQDDITDGTKYLIAQHMADPARIALVGATFGGYAALEGVVREPTLYRCAAAWAPVTDLPLLVGGPTAFAQSDLNLPLPGTDYGDIEAVSPAYHADSIQVPVLLMQGRKDFTVQVEQTQLMASALKRAGKTFQVVYLEEADHYFGRPDERLAWLQALEKFLAANLRPRS